MVLVRSGFKPIMFFPFFPSEGLSILNICQIMYLIIGVHNTKTDPVSVA